MVRRLPVVQTKSPEDAAAEARPRWQWAVIGAGFVVTLWLPLAMIALAIRHGPLPIALSFAIAALVSGLLVGRFGGRARVRETCASGALGALAGWILAALSGGLGPSLFALVALGVLVALGSASAGLGGLWGIRLRRRTNAPRRTNP